MFNGRLHQFPLTDAALVMPKVVESWAEALAQLHALFAPHYGIEHPTFQPEIDRQPPPILGVTL